MFITFEGIEGSGKTTQLRRLAGRLPDAVITKEPGGTPLADEIREILLDARSRLDPVAEMFLFAASRRQNVAEVIRPALERGHVVLCDRYTDATLAYQGFGRLLDLDRLRMVNDWATGSLQPDITVLLDLPGITDADRTHFHSNRWRHVLDHSELADSRRELGIPKNRHPRDGCNILAREGPPWAHEESRDVRTANDEQMEVYINTNTKKQMAIIKERIEGRAQGRP